MKEQTNETILLIRNSRADKTKQSSDVTRIISKSQKKKIELPYDPTIPLLGIYLEERKDVS